MGRGAAATGSSPNPAARRQSGAGGLRSVLRPLARRHGAAGGAGILGEASGAGRSDQAPAIATPARDIGATWGHDAPALPEAACAGAALVADRGDSRGVVRLAGRDVGPAGTGGDRGA